MIPDDTHRTIVDIYLRACRDTWLAAEQTDDPHTRMLAAVMRQAKLIEIPPAAYTQLAFDVDHYLTEEVAGFTWRQWDDPRKIPPEENRAYMEAVSRAAGELAYPERLPFEVCCFAFGTGVGVGPSRAEVIGQGHKLHNPSEWIDPSTGRVSARIVFLLATASGWVFETYLSNRRLVDTDGGYYSAATSIIFRNPDRGWYPPHFAALGTPWHLACLVDAVNAVEHLHAIPHGLSIRLRAQKLGKGFGGFGRRLLPPPYYRVELREHTFRQTLHDLPSRPRHWSHRWDVRGHYVTRVQRGALPIDEAQRRKLTRRGYAIVEGGSALPSEFVSALVRRHVAPPRPGEWIAVHRAWREAHVRGPKGKPYVPSTRHARTLDVERPSREAI